jgi:phosphoglycolate phosphatase-like HAD superfamily hydrolase
VDVDFVLLDLDGTVWDAGDIYRRLGAGCTSTSNVARWVKDSQALAGALSQEPPHVTQVARAWLARTRAAGVRVVAVTNLPQVAAEQIASAAGLEFDAIYGMARGRQAKPSPNLLTLAAREVGIPQGRAVMVGNALPDAVAARRAGVRFQWAGWSEAEPPAGVAVAPGWNDIGADAPEHVGRWLYKIWTDYDGLTPSLFERAADGVAAVGWRQRLDEVEEGDPVAVWFSGSKVSRPGIYATCEVAGVDLGRSTVQLRLLRLSRDEPLVNLTGADALVRPRRKQVFWYSPRSTANCSVDDPGADSCAIGSCPSCPTFASIPRIDLRHLKPPARLDGIDSYLPAVWVVAKRSRAYYARPNPSVVSATERFMRLKNGERGLAQHFAYLIAHQVLDSKAGWLDRDFVLVPVPLDPAKQESGEEHRTLMLARALTDLLPRTRVVEALSLSESVGKRRMRRDGASYHEFQARYGESLLTRPLPDGVTDVVLVDDVCTEGGTLTECAAAIRRASPHVSSVHALTAGQMTIQQSVVNWSAILDREPTGIGGRAIPTCDLDAAPRASRPMESLALPTKLVDCRACDDGTELFIIEGDSAMATAKAARDSEFQALLPVRGKILNVQNGRSGDVLKNQECASIVQVLGAGFGPSFDLEAVRYEKIILMADADADGAHLRCLLATLFFKYMPELLEAGRVYVAMPPLHRIEVTDPRVGQDAYVYANSDDGLHRELAELSKECGTWKEPVQRVRGFGEMDADQLAETTMDPRRRTLRRLTVGSAGAAARVFELLMGSEAATRREFIVKAAPSIDASRLDA